MRIISLLLLVALAALVHSRTKNSRREKRELLVRSKRRWVLSTIELQEEDKGPYRKKISQMFNNMSGDNHEFRISGMGVDKPPLGVFEIDKKTGDVFALRPLDRETYQKPFHIKFDILHRDTKLHLDKELAFDVELQDINDNAPKFESPRMFARVKESTREKYLPVQLRVTDIDKEDTPNSKITVTFLSQEPKAPKIGLEQIDGRLAQLTLDGCFEYEKVKKYEITVQAKDHGTPPMSSTAVVTLNIEDTNTYLPMFKKKEYQTEVLEATTKKDLLRVDVEDKDNPNTAGWRAVYYFIKGNEENNYGIETDPVTNEGILSVIKGKDHEKTTSATLEIGVKNEAPLSVCTDFKDGGKPGSEDTAKITVKVIDINDPPVFDKDPADVYHKEEEPPGKVLHKPKVYDAEGDTVRYLLIDDPAGWVTIDETTGEVKSVKPMDRESPFVDNTTGVYEALIAAIDDGEPSATGTCTVRIHLGDINDNLPQLVSKDVIMCGNKLDKVMVKANDSDDHPFGGPFTFALGGDDKSLAERWKLDPATGEEAGLISVKPLPYGTYPVPLLIQDQQNMIGRDTVEVTVCDCGDKDICNSKRALSTSLGGPGIGLIFVGLLLFLLLLLLFMCHCAKKQFTIPTAEDEGNQTLIKYNQEGGGSECKSVPTLPTETVTVTDDIKVATKQMTKAAPVVSQHIETFNSYGQTMINSQMTSTSSQFQRDTIRDSYRSQGEPNMFSMRNTFRSNNNQLGSSSRYQHSQSLRQNLQVADHLDRRLRAVDGNDIDHPLDKPNEYTDEGRGSKAHSLDRLSFHSYGDLNFLNDLGPQFKTLGGLLQQGIKEKKIKF